MIIYGVAEPGYIKHEVLYNLLRKWKGLFWRKLFCGWIGGEGGEENSSEIVGGWEEREKIQWMGFGDRVGGREGG